MSKNNGVSVGRKIAYGIGSVAFGVKNNGFDYFFLIFYSQVMGVSAYLVIRSRSMLMFRQSGTSTGSAPSINMARACL